MLHFTGKLSHEEKSTEDVDAGFATVEESSVGKKDINRGWFLSKLNDIIILGQYNIDCWGQETQNLISGIVPVLHLSREPR